jgi:two-component system chemotaxis response regulator CheY
MKTILAVDDDTDIHNLLKVYLKGLYSLKTASSGVEALDLLVSGKIEKPDLILLDMEMPLMNGKVFQEKLLQIPEFKNIPIIYFSANDQYKDEVELTNEFSFLNKPIEKEDLKSVLDSFFRLHKS